MQVHSELELEVPVEHGLLLENLLDLAHAPFTHTTTFARGWPVPDVVKFHEANLLGGNWEPYPIEMSFQPPCMVLSTIGMILLSFMQVSLFKASLSVTWSSYDNGFVTSTLPLDITKTIFWPMIVKFSNWAEILHKSNLCVLRPR